MPRDPIYPWICSDGCFMLTLLFLFHDRWTLCRGPCHEPQMQLCFQVQRFHPCQWFLRLAICSPCHEWWQREGCMEVEPRIEHESLPNAGFRGQFHGVGYCKEPWLPSLPQPEPRLQEMSSFLKALPGFVYIHIFPVGARCPNVVILKSTAMIHNSYALYLAAIDVLRSLRYIVWTTIRKGSCFTLCPRI